MSHISNYLHSNLNTYLSTFHKKYDLIHPYVKNKKNSSNNIYSNYSLFSNNYQNINHVNNYDNENPNINYYDFGKNMNIPLSYGYKKEKKYMSKSSEQDLDILKLQLRCDLIGQKINQIQNQVQNFHESNSCDDKKILKKNRTYGNLNENKILNNFNNNIDYVNKNYEKKNIFKIPVPIKRDIGLGDGFRERKNKDKIHNISYVNKNINNNYLINNYNVKNDNINKKNNNFFKQSSFYNSNNPRNQNLSMINDNNIGKKYDKIITNKINSNPNIIKQKDNCIAKYNNYINDYNAKINFIPNSIERNNKKISKKAQILRKNFSAKQSKSNNISPTKNNIIIKNRKKNGINEKIDFDKNLYNVSKYGSFDKYFLNDNNYTDNSYINYICTIKNNFNDINYNNLERIKKNSFSDEKIKQINRIKQNNFVIQKGFDINIKNKNESKFEKKDINIINFNNNDNKTMKNYNNSFNKNNTLYPSNNRKDKMRNNNTNNKKIKETKHNQMQINNNFNVNNNTNYYNFNYNQNNNKDNYDNKQKNMKNNKKHIIKSKKNNNNKNNSKNNFFKDNLDENSINDNLKLNHDYSNDDMIHTSDIFNSLNDDNLKLEYAKKPNIIFEKVIKTNINSKRKKMPNSNNLNYPIKNNKIK